MNIKTMETLVMKRITPIDLVDSDVKANKIMNAHDAHGAFRKVHFGNYRVLKVAGIIPKLWRQGDGDLWANRINRREYEIWEQYKHIGILGEITWVSEDWKYLVMERLETSTEYKAPLFRELFSEFWFDSTDGIRESAIKCADNLRWIMYSKKISDSKEKFLQNLSEFNIDKRILPSKIEWDKEIYKRMLELPAEILLDAHYQNWGVANGCLKLLDYGDC